MTIDYKKDAKYFFKRANEATVSIDYDLILSKIEESSNQGYLYTNISMKYLFHEGYYCNITPAQKRSVENLFSRLKEDNFEADLHHKCDGDYIYISWKCEEKI